MRIIAPYRPGRAVGEADPLTRH